MTRVILKFLPCLLVGLRLQRPMQLLDISTLNIHIVEEAKFVIFEILLTNINMVMMQGFFVYSSCAFNLQFSFLWSFLIQSNHIYSTYLYGFYEPESYSYGTRVYRHRYFVIMLVGSQVCFSRLSSGNAMQ